MSTTLRIMKRDRERLEKLAKRTKNSKLVNALRFALSSAEREMDKYHGDLKSISRAQKFARPGGGRVSSNIDENLVEVLFEETHEK